MLCLNKGTNLLFIRKIFLNGLQTKFPVKQAEGMASAAIKAGAWVIFAIIFVGLVLSAAGIAMYLPNMLRYSSLEATLQQFIADALNVIILLELMALVALYITKESVRLEYALDAAAIFIIRELMLSVYMGRASFIYLMSLAIMLSVVIASRIVVIRFGEERGAGS